MIYLIQTSYYNEDTNTPLRLLKIGYTRDESLNKRLTQYKLHNPRAKLLYTIPGATEEDELKVQYKFKKLLYSDYGREWFVYDNEIIEFFKIHTTLDSLRRLNLPSPQVATQRIISRLIGNFLLIKNERSSDNVDFIDIAKEYEKLFLEFKDYESVPEISNILFKRLGVDISSYSFPLVDSAALCEYNKLRDTRLKLKFLCELSDPETFKFTVPFSHYCYYKVLGSTRLKSLGYNITYIKREYDDLLLEGTIDISERIYSIFTVGEKYLKSEVKEILRNLYESLGISRTPKATDLLDYFETKEGLLPNSVTRKRDRCYEIIKKKEL
jgi:hypothetical protein